MNHSHKSLISVLVSILCGSLLALTLATPVAAETAVHDGMAPDKESEDTEPSPQAPESASEEESDESEVPATGPSLRDGYKALVSGQLPDTDRGSVGPRAPTCGTHEHHQFSSGYACNSAFDPEPQVPSKCPVRVFEVLVPVLLIGASAGIWGVVGTTVAIEAGVEIVVEIYGWVKKPRAAVFGHVYRTVREEVCGAFGYSS